MSQPTSRYWYRIGRRARIWPVVLLTALLLAGSVAVAAPTDDLPSRGVSRSVAVVGALELEPSGVLAHANVAAYRNLAFVGKYGGPAGPCAASGVDIIDIGDPAAPVKVASTTAHSGTGMAAVRAMRIRNRDVLATGLYACRHVPGDGLRGLELFDITDPTQPQRLSFFEAGADIAFLSGVVGFDLTTSPGGRALALLGVNRLEEETATPGSGFTDGTGDLLILDITDPTDPHLIGEWGVLSEPLLGLDYWLDARQGQSEAVQLGGVRANRSGTRVYLSYSDAGHIILDIRDPANPRFLGATEYPPDAEGNASNAAEARGGNLLIGADQDFHPFQLALHVNQPAALAGNYPATEPFFIPSIAELPGRALAADIVHVGRGCPPDPDVVPGGDPYLADPAGKIALIARGACRFDNKIAWAQLHGAIGVMIYNDRPGLILFSVDNPVTVGSPAVTGTQITIPAVMIEQTIGSGLADALDAAHTVDAAVVADFVGWGFLRVFDISDPTTPLEIGSFASEGSLDPDRPVDGFWTAHIPEVRGNTVYASWFEDGVRIIDISDPSHPREIGSWTGQGAPDHAPPVNIWRVLPHRDLLLASDLNFGLYILKHTPHPAGHGG